MISETSNDWNRGFYWLTYLFQVTGHSSVSPFIVRNEEEAKKRSRSRVFRYSDNSGATERKKYLDKDTKNIYFVYLLKADLWWVAIISASTTVVSPAVSDKTIPNLKVWCQENKWLIISELTCKLCPSQGKWPGQHRQSRWSWGSQYSQWWPDHWAPGPVSLCCLYLHK